MADTAEAGDHFLADVAALGGADGVGFEASFGREGVGSYIDTPERQAAGDSQRFPGSRRRGVWFPWGRGGYPEVEPRFPEAGGRIEKTILGGIGWWGGESGEMGETKRVRDVFHDDVIGDDELFQAGAERFAEGGIRLDPKRIGGGADPAVGLQLSLGGEIGRAHV